jgi:type II secretory pathway pseudopilin PulG
LIELLVVIAIIAILAAILFPVFAQAKAAAKKAVALSNIKEIALGSIMYSNDYDDTCVPYFSYYSGPPNYTFSDPGQYWPANLSPYIQKAQTQLNGSGGQQPFAENLSGVFFDPTEPFKKQAGDPNCAYGDVASWGISDDFVNWWAPHAVNATYQPVNYGQVAAPANTVVFAETYDWLCGENYPGSTLALSYFDYNNKATNGAMRTLQAPYQATYPKTSFTQEVDPNGIQNPGFADGHVKSTKLALLTHSGQYWSVTGNNQWP